jgi:hypothetical protein
MSSFYRMTMMTQIMPKNAEIFTCEKCDFTCSKHSNYRQHLTTLKHRGVSQMMQENAKSCQCECGKSYRYRQGLFTHRKKCPIYNEKNVQNTNIVKNENNFNNEKKEITPTDKEIKTLTNLVLEVVKNNHDLHKQMIDMCKHNTSTTNIQNMNNSNNKTFNLQFFLNEECKDAMNIMDFVNSIKLQLEDLESVGKLGYIEGISDIMIKKLNEIEIHKRPVHCSDSKRETVYVKDDNKWEKENISYSRLRKAIKYISKKNSDLLTTWSDKYPGSKNISNYLNEEYMRMIAQAMGGSGEIDENENKIIKKIARGMIIDKN